MRLLVQRVRSAEVRVAERSVGRIGHGLSVLVGVGHGDTEVIARQMADRVVDLRIFRDGAGRTNRSLIDVGGELLAVSQFTLYGDTRRGRRPSFIDAAPAAQAESLVERFAEGVAARGVLLGRGLFGAEMELELINDGPMTIWLDSTAH